MKEQLTTEELSKKEKARAYYQAYREANREKAKAYNAAYREKKGKQWYNSNKERLNVYNKNWITANKEAIKKQGKAYREANKEILRARRLERRSEWNTYYSNKLKTDDLFKLKHNIRNHTKRTFKRIGKNNPTDTLTLLGCSWEEAKAHIESKFVEGMSWSNHGEWHIDHIIPIASATTIEEVAKLNHISNLQPLWALDNLRKGARGNAI